MKRTISLLLFFISSGLLAQTDPLTGSWKGYLEFGGRKMDIIIDLKKDGDLWQGSLSSEKQQLKDIPLSNISIKSDSLFFDVPMAGGRWKGAVQNELTGHWLQGPMKAPLNFQKLEAAPALKIRKRTQTPEPPYPYLVKEVSYRNMKDSTRLAATLTLPKGDGPFPAAILLTVAGPNDRDQSHGSPQHKPYMVLADYLTGRGIAVLRADDRGVGGSGGDLFQSTIEDFAHDALAGFEWLKQQPQIDTDQIGFIGNSEGTLVGPLAASINPEVAFIITLGGIGVAGSEVILDQVDAIGAIAQLSEGEIASTKQSTERLFELLSESKNDDILERSIRAEWSKKPYGDKTRSLFLIPNSIDEQVRIFTSPWYRYQVTYQPGPILEKVDCPFLALHGDQDPFVMPDKNLKAIAHWLDQGGNKKHRQVKLENVNHVFQDATNGSPALYSQNETSFSPRALTLIYEWLDEMLRLN